MTFVKAFQPWSVAQLNAPYSGLMAPTAPDPDAIQWIQKLTEGGYGEVWLGYWPRHRANVVGKFLRETKDPTTRKGFAREIRILLRNFPGFVRVFRADANAARPYYIMEYFPQGPIVRWAGALGRDQLIRIASDISTFLATLHLNGIAHGDVKPQNLLLGNDGRVRVADPIGCGWGCTRLFAENRGGTPGYWAPEISKGHSISASGDVWSFGATMHHLATGIHPIDGKPFNLRYPLFGAAPEIAETVKACCQLRPNDRPAMTDIPLILKGESWAVVRRAHQQAQRNALIGAGTAAILLTALTSA